METKTELCSTCGKHWSHPEATYCSNPFHLAAPQVFKQLSDSQEHNRKLIDELQQTIAVLEQLKLSENIESVRNLTLAFDNRIICIKAALSKAKS